MKNNTYTRILYFIGVVILITFCIQIYWNYQNYQAGKQKLINEVQISLDNAVDQYFASRAQRKTRYSLDDVKGNVNNIKVISMDTALVRGTNRNFISIESDTIKASSSIRFPSSISFKKIEPIDIESIEVMGSSIGNLDSLVSTIIVSMKQDSLNLVQLDSLVQTELKRKNIWLDYGLSYKRPGQKEQSFASEGLREVELHTKSKSTWLPQNSELSLYFSNETTTILKSNMIGLFLSGLLMAAVIGCLLFLLRIINDQKQLADLKNDLISNITHEFKTPISTIRIAMEGILYFNKEKDMDKVIKYALTSTNQVEKLNNMVEKLLETATITGNQLILAKEELNLVPIFISLIQKYGMLATHKSLKFASDREAIHIYADPFHLENAFSNILDNAVKYGGNEITVHLASSTMKIKITFTDNGNSLTKAETDQIFEKFYRVPKGNTHDVKGFGIGLYYTKQIIERHGGSIKVKVMTNTKFIIEIPL